MMEECIKELQNKLVLTDREKTGVKVDVPGGDVPQFDGGLCLVGKILAARYFGGEAVLEAMCRAWQVSGVMDVKAIGENVFFFKFENRADLVRAKTGGPWHFDNNALVLSEFDGNLTMEEYTFNAIRVWAQIRDLPLKFMSINCAKQMGNAIGKFINWDKGTGQIIWGKYMRIRVELQIDQPLMRGLNLDMEDGSTKWVRIKYEKLPFLCYHCGLIGHRFRNCPVILEKEYESDYEGFQYPKSLEAEITRRRNNSGRTLGGDSGVAAASRTRSRDEHQGTPDSEVARSAQIAENVGENNHMDNSGDVRNLNSNRDCLTLFDFQKKRDNCNDVLELSNPVIEGIENVGNTAVQNVGCNLDKEVGCADVNDLGSGPRKLKSKMVNEVAQSGLVDVTISVDKFAGPSVSKKGTSKRASWTRRKRPDGGRSTNSVGMVGKRKAGEPILSKDSKISKGDVDVHLGLDHLSDAYDGGIVRLDENSARQFVNVPTLRAVLLNDDHPAVVDVQHRRENK